MVRQAHHPERLSKLSLVEGQITMTKIPISKRSKYDIPNILVWVIGYWNLGFICNLVLGIWNL